MRCSGIGLTALSCVVLVRMYSVLANEIPASQSAAVSDAEVQGQALYDAAKAAPARSDGDVVQTAKALIKDFCDFTYRAVVINTTDGPLIYFLALPAKDGDVVYGRHYKVVGNAVTPSTKSCFVQPQSTRAVAAIVTHLLSDTPTEFHVYLSLAQGKPIYVATASALWVVEKGKIRFVEQRQASGGSATPVDRPLSQSDPQLQKLEAAMAPYVARAKESYPQARARFLAGLPSGQRFYIVARVVDSTGKWEQVFIRVKSIQDGRVTGTIASDTTLVTSFKNGDPYEFAESDLVDWLIKKPDGSEEGNVVGKFLDTYKQ